MEITSGKIIYYTIFKSNFVTRKDNLTIASNYPYLFVIHKYPYIDKSSNQKYPIK